MRRRMRDGLEVAFLVLLLGMLLYQSTSEDFARLRGAPDNWADALW